MGYSPHQKRSPDQWQALLDRQAASGLSQAAFCASHGLAKSTFQHWKRRLQPGSSAAVDVPALFAPLPGGPDTPASAPDSGWSIELDLGDGVCLRFRRGTS